MVCHAAFDAPPGYCAQVLGNLWRQARRRGGLRHRMGQRVLAAGLHRCRVAQQGLRIAGVHRFMRHQPGLALGQRAGLVEGHHAHLAHQLQGLRVAHQDAALCRQPRADHQRRRRGQAQRARAGDDEHRDRVDDGHGPVAVGPTPAEQRQQRHSHDHRHEHRADAVDGLLDRRLPGLRRLDHAHDARQRRLGADRGGAQHHAALAVDGAARDPFTGLARDGQALAGEHRLVEVAEALDQLAVHRHPFAGPDHDFVADLYLGQRHAGFDAIAAHGGAVGSQRAQRFERIQRAPLGAGFKPLAQQHQRDHDRRAFEVQVRHAIRVLRPQVQAQCVRRAGAQRDQQVHVAAASAQGLPARAVETCTEPELHRRGERELQPRREHPVRAEGVAHHRQRQRRAQQRGQRHAPAGVMARARRGCGGTVAGQCARLVTCTPDSSQQGRGQRRTGLRRGHDMGLRSRQVDAGRQDPGHRQQRTLDAADTGRAGHAVDGQVKLRPRYRVAGLFDCSRQCGGVRALLHRHRRLLGGQVDAGCGHAGHRGQRLFHAADAGRAGHAVDRQVEGLCRCHALTLNLAMMSRSTVGALFLARAGPPQAGDAPPLGGRRRRRLGGRH